MRRRAPLGGPAAIDVARRLERRPELVDGERAEHLVPAQERAGVRAVTWPGPSGRCPRPSGRCPPLRRAVERHVAEPPERELVPDLLGEIAAHVEAPRGEPIRVGAEPGGVLLGEGDDRAAQGALAIAAGRGRVVLLERVVRAPPARAPLTCGA
ncbi:hypothetical protein BE11_34045 [Sorangium cellulosum]|nr:hypothetical protein BE11_34045 [Sorangium cellulosum]